MLRKNPHHFLKISDSLPICLLLRWDVFKNSDADPFMRLISRKIPIRFWITTVKTARS